MKQPDRALVEALDPFLTGKGFKFIKSRYAYIRNTATGFEDFGWSSYPLATGEKWEAGYYEGGYGLGLRSDAVQEIWNVLGLSYGRDVKGHRPTVHRPVGSPNGKYFAFDPSRDQELCLRFDHLERDVAETAGRIETMLEADGWAWYARYADPVALSRDINSPLGGLDPHPLVNNPGHRPLVGVAAACVGESERVPELVEGWLTVIRGYDEQFADQRPPKAESFVQKFELIVDKARELGHEVALH